ncbi:MAG: hypothetical protein K6E20_00805, partial [Acholeplasmatales bacterium]|nr:hypothetical protein [Acholeplasmatales bacterium]
EPTGVEESVGVSTGSTTAASTTGSTATTTAASTSAASATSSVVATSASLAGGVTILVAAAAAVVGSNALNKAPKMLFEEMEVGADYCIYDFEIDQSSLYSDATYTVELEYNNEKITKTIDKNVSHQRMFFSNLKEGTSYKYRIAAKYNKLETYYYNEKMVRTKELKAPKAIFEFTPDITLEADGTNRYNLDYSVYISNVYGDVSQSYVTIYQGQDESVNNEINKKNFIEGTLFDVKDNQELIFTAYTYYGNEIVKLESEYFNVQYPSDFVRPEDVYNSKYVFNEDSLMNYSYNLETGSSFTIETGFDNSIDSNEAMKFDFYDADDNLIEDKTVITQDASYEVNLEPMYSQGTITMTPIKYVTDNSSNSSVNPLKKADGEDYVEFEPTTIPFKFDPVFVDTLLSVDSSILVFSTSYFEEIDKELKLTGTITKKDGTSINIDDVFTSSDIFKEISVNESDIDKFDATISYTNGDGKVIKLFHYDNDFEDKIEFGDINYKTDTTIPYEMTLPKNATIDSCTFEYTSGGTEGGDLVDKTGLMNLSYIVSPNVSGDIFMTYLDKYGVSVSRQIPFKFKVLTPNLFTNVTLTPYLADPLSEDVSTFVFTFEYAGIYEGDCSYKIVTKTLDESGNILSTYDEDTYENLAIGADGNLAAGTDGNLAVGTEIEHDLDANTAFVEASIYYQDPDTGTDDLIRTYNFDLDSIDSISDVTELEIDDDGNVIIPYTVKEIEGATLSRITAFFSDGTEETIETTDITGNITISELNANLLNGNITAIYTDDETGFEFGVGYHLDVNLNAAVNMDYFVPFVGSNLIVAVKYDVLINGKEVNMDLGLTALKGNGLMSAVEEVNIEQAVTNSTELEGYEAYENDYYLVEIVSNDTLPEYLSNTIKINATGFDSSEYEDISTFSLTVLGAPSSQIPEFDSYTLNSDMKYYVIDNGDGTTSFMFDTGFVEGAAKITHKQRFTFGYLDENGNKQVIVKFLDDNSLQQPVITLPTRDYDVYYNFDIEYNDVLYSCNIIETAYLAFERAEIDPELARLVETDELEVSGDDLKIKQSIDLNYIDKDVPITFVYNDIPYEVPYYDSTSSVVTLIDADTYEYTVNGDGYQAYVYMAYGTTMEITLTLTSTTFDPMVDTIKLQYAFACDNLISDINTKYGTSYPLDRYNQEYECQMFAYDTTYGEYTIENSSGRTYDIYADIISGNSSTDTAVLKVMYDGNVIDTIDGSIYNGRMNFSYSVPYYVDNVDFYVEYVKYFGGEQFVYKEEFIDNLELGKIELTNQEVIANEDGTYTIKGTLSDQSITEYTVYEFDSDGTFVTSSGANMTYDGNNSYEFTFTPTTGTNYVSISYGDIISILVPLNPVSYSPTDSEIVFTINSNDSDLTDGHQFVIADEKLTYDIEFQDSSGVNIDHTVSDDDAYTTRIIIQNCTVVIEFNVNDYISYTFKQDINIS